MFSSNNTPKNLTAVVLSIALLPIFNSEGFRGISLTEFFWKNVYLFFFFNIQWQSVCLKLASNFMEFIIYIQKSVKIFRWEKKILVSSANIMGSKIFQALQRSVTYIKNNKGPSIDPWRAPQVIFAKFVFLLLKDWNCLWFNQRILLPFTP